MNMKSIPAFLLLLVLTANAYGQAAKQLLSVPTIADLEMRIPQAGEVVEVRNGSASNLWAAPRTFTYRTNTETADRVYVVTNRVAGTRYVATDRDNGVCDLSLWATGDGTTDDTARILQAVALMQDGHKLYSPPGKRYRVSSTIEVTNSRVTVDFNGSSLVSVITDRSPALRIGPAQILLSGMDFSLSTSTNRVTGVPAGTFAAGDMVLLHNLIQNPADYYPGQFAFVDSASGTEMTLDRFPDDALQVTNAVRFVAPPQGVTVRNLMVDLSLATDGEGITVIGKGHVVENCKVWGTGTTTDPNYIGITARGQAITVRGNYVNGILDAGNTSDRAGYGIFLAGDGNSAEGNDVQDCKHDISTSERRAYSTKLRILDNRIRQREDWAAVTSSPGLYLFLGALDVHANVRTVEIRGNDIRAPRLGLSIRNGDFDVVNNRVEIREQSGLPYVQHGNGFGEAFITRGVLMGNTFIAPTNATQFYWDHSDYGATGTHRKMAWIGNVFMGAGLAITDQEGATVNPFEDLIIQGNFFERTNGTPLAIIGSVSNAVVSGNVFRYGGTGNGISVAIPESAGLGREVFVSANTFVRSPGGTGYDIDATQATNVVALGLNRWSSSTYSYVGPVHGIAPAIAVAMHDQRDTFPRIVGTYDGDLKFGPGDTQPSTSVSMLFPGALQTDGTWTIKLSDLTQPAFGTYLNNFSNYWNFVIRGDGVLVYRHTNELDGGISSPIVLGPRRWEDLTNGTIRLTGNLGITSNAIPTVPETGTATWWLANAAAEVRDLRIVWPDGSGGKVDGKVWHQYSDGSGSGLDADLLDGLSSEAFQTALSFTNGITNSAGSVMLSIAAGANITLSTNAGQITIAATGGGGTNASRVFFDGTAVDSPNIVSGPEILLTIAGVTNITPTIKTNSIGTNQFNNTTYAAVFSGAIAESRVDAAIARLLSPAFTGSPTAPTAADGTSNTVLATTAWVLRNAGTGGGGSGNADTNASQAWAAATTNTFNGRVVVAGQLEVADLIINAATYTGVWGFANGGLGVTNATDARVVLGLVIGTDVQAFDADLLRVASVSWASGDFVYRDGTGLTNFVSTAAGRSMLAAANADAQWVLLSSSATTNGDYSASSWDGITDKVPNLNQIRDALVNISNAVTSANPPLSLTNGTLSLDTNGLVLSGTVPYDPMADYPDWQVLTWNFDTSSATTALEPGLGNIAVNSGSFANQTSYVFSGTGGQFCKAAASVDTDTGGGITMNGSSSTAAYTALGTNVNRFRADLFFATTNPTVAIIGMSDFFSQTQNPSDAVVWTVTNMVARPAAMSNSVTTYSSSTFTLQSSVSYSFEVSQTNTSARFLIYSNNVAVSDIMLTNGLPMNATNYLSPVMVYVKNNGSTALTNAATMMVVDRIRSARKLR